MDPRTGEILALANWPRVDANDRGGAPGYARAEPRGRLHLRAGLDVQGVHRRRARCRTAWSRPTRRSTCRRRSRSPTATIGESHAARPETLTTAQILAQSSNVGAITIGQRLGAKRFDHWVRKFGFGKPTGVDLPGEERGLVLPLDKYSGSSMGNLPIGQGMAVTPMQMAPAYAAIANGGILRTPHVVAASTASSLPEPKGTRIISRSTAAQLRTMLEGVFAPGGTASEVVDPRLRAGRQDRHGEQDRPEDRRVLEDRTTSPRSWASRPRSDPKLLIAVMVDEPQGAIYGGVGRGARVRQDRLFALPYLRIPPQLESARGRCGCASSSATPRATPDGRGHRLAYDNRAVTPGHAVLLRAAASRATATTSRPTPSRAARSRSSSSARSASACPRSLVDDVRAAMAPAAARASRRPDRARSTSSASPARTARRRRPSSSARCSRPPGAATGAARHRRARRRRRGERAVARTTPEAIDLQATFAEMLDARRRRRARWRSPRHALELHRADAIHWAVAVFTNLTQDHLDFHPTMEDYFLAKRRLFEAGAAACAVVNVDDPYGRAPGRRAARRGHASASTRRTPQLRAPDLARRRRRGSRLRGRRPAAALAAARALQRRSTRSAAVAVARALGVDDATIAAALPRAGRVPGRFEPVDEGQPFAVLVDYAHTPDSLENVLRAARELADGPRDRRRSAPAATATAASAR